MICPICKIREATFHITENNKKAKSFHSCEDCKKNFPLTLLLCEDIEKLKQSYTMEETTKIKRQLPLIKHIDVKNILESLPDEQPKLFCEKCGNTLTNLLKKGVIGCELDYTHFFKFIEKALLNTQGSSLHKGKQILESELDLLTSKLHSLEFKLKKAIETENYELAGALTKEINTLKKP